MAGVGNIEVVVESCSVMKVPGLERHLLRNEDYSRRREGESVLTSGDISLLVVDRLCDQATRQSTAVTCFYFDFAARKELSVTSTLGSLVQQVVRETERVSEEISEAFQEQMLVIGGRET